MAFLGMLKDSLRESLDRRSLTVLLVISTLFIFVCGSIGYGVLRIEQVIEEMKGKFEQTAGGRWRNERIDARFDIADIRPVGAEPGREEFEGGTSFRVGAQPLVEFQKLVVYSLAVKGKRDREWPRTVPGISEDFKQVLTPPSTEDMAWFIGAKLRENNFTRPKVEVEGIEGDRAVFRVWLKKTSTAYLSGGFRLSILFGAWKWDLGNTSVADVVFSIQNTLAGLIAGWIGILVAIISTAAFIPNMIQKGTVDLLLARPMPRWRLFLYKYCGGLIFVTITAGYLIVGSWFVMAVRSGIWSPGYLAAWPLLVFFFAALYSVSSLIGLLTRSSIAAILLSAVTWLILSMIGSAYYIVHMPEADIDQDHAVVKAVDMAHAVLPRLKDVDQAIALVQLKANGISEDHYRHISHGGDYPKVDWAALFGVTGAWMAALLALGCWRFSRRDY